MSWFRRAVDDAIYGPAKRIPAPDPAKIKAHIGKIRGVVDAPNKAEPLPVIGLDLPKVLNHRRREMTVAIERRKLIEDEQRRVKLAYEFEMARLDEALRQTVTVVASQSAAIKILAEDPALISSGANPDDEDYLSPEEREEMDAELAAAMDEELPPSIANDMGVSS